MTHGRARQSNHVDQTRTSQSRYRTADIPGAAPLVPASDASGAMVARAARATFRWLRTAAVAAGVLYVVTWVALTLGVPVLARMAWRESPTVSTLGRRAAADLMRPWALPRDGAITPEEAGLAFFSLERAPRASTPGAFTYRRIADRPVVPWHAPGPDARAVFGIAGGPYNGPDPRTIIADARRGLSAERRALLRSYATAPSWQVYDRVARAPKVDFIAGRFELPFGPDASPYTISTGRVSGNKEFAYASTARAAWYVTQGRPDLAEAALRSTISVGLQLLDNGTSLIDELVGASVVKIGREGLARLFEATGDPRLAQLKALEARAASVDMAPPVAGTASFSARRQAVIDAASKPGDMTVPERIELLWGMPAMACTSTRDLLRGESPEMRAAFDAVRRDYADLPGQRAVIDLIESQFQRPTPLSVLGVPDGPGAIVAGASRVFFNPRLTNCALVLFGP